MRANPRTAPENGQLQRWHTATVLLGSCLLLLGQVFAYLKNILVAASHGGTDHILATYQHIRRSGDARATDLGLRLLHPGTYADAVVGVDKFLGVHPVLSHEIRQCLCRIQRATLPGQRIEQSVVPLVEFTYGFKGVESVGMGLPALPQGRRQANVVYILRRLLFPGFRQGLEVVTVGTAIPEHLGHLDTAV